MSPTKTKSLKGTSTSLWQPQSPCRRACLPVTSPLTYHLQAEERPERAEVSHSFRMALL